MLTLMMNSAKELEHFERVRRMFESADEAQKKSNQQKPKNKQLTIGEAVNGIQPGDEISLPDGPMSHSATKTKYGSLRGKGKGKGKGKSVAAFGTEDSDGDGDAHDDVVGNGVNGVKSKGKGKSPVDVDGADESEDEYLVKTDHLVKS